jgi:long-subunit acyl-CoA synthetase (AMP-forming)
MNDSRTWCSDMTLPQYPQNLASMLNGNVERLGDRPLYQEMKDGTLTTLSWRILQHDVARLQHSLKQNGLGKGDRVAILSPNCKEMLELELAIMAMGAVSVPIFSGYPPDQAHLLVEFCEPLFIAVADTVQFNKIKSPEKYKLIIHFGDLNCKAGPNTASFSQLINSSLTAGEIGDESVAADSICLMMYTSGTMGKPKLVQLTHSNILSQQAAMRILWQLDQHDRLLSYLPWHHSFGGIFEKFAAVYNGALLSLEHGYGKNIDTLLENWIKVKPTVFFSVPRIYQQITTRILQNPSLEQKIFHDELRFIFTAAAPLPKNISELFENRHIPVYEGWGLTETSPCCTITDPAVKREPAVVGKPIAGVTLKLADDGEIYVRGPNVMKGYYHNEESTKTALSEDGWFATGDIGEFAETGLRLISRKDRIFKLTNAEKVVPTDIENLIIESCPFLSHAFVTGSGRDYPVVLLFPNRTMLFSKPDSSRISNECDCPRDLKNLAGCLANCLKRLNDKIDARYMRPSAALLIDHELSIEREELTPSMKLAPNIVANVFKAQIEFLYGGNAEGNGTEDVYILKLEQD